MSGTAPFLRFVLCLGLGIVVGDWLLNLAPALAELAPLLLLGGVTAGFVSVITFKRSSRTQALSVFVTLFCLGGLVGSLKHRQFAEEVAALTGKQYDSALLEITSHGQKRRTTHQFEARVRQLHQENSWQPVSAKVLISIGGETMNLPQPGDFIVVKARELVRPKPALNPNQMDYADYLRRRGIAWTIYLPAESFLTLDEKANITLMPWPARVSQEADSVLQVYLGGGESYGLVKAMLLGRRDDLGPDLLQSYASAGAIHVLAVSGLHVGVLFLLLSLSLGWLKKWRWGRGVYVLSIVLLLGAYALITGLSPSVVRASLMCVVLATSQAVSRKHHSLNALALSAFLILLLDPLSLFSVGFQLSYAAVAGILLLYPLGKNLIHSRFRVVNWLWQISLIGLAAQLFTFPISVYYFHQFPTYFWLVNPFVILLTSVLIYSALAVFAGGSFVLSSPLATFFAFLTERVGNLMNYLVAWPARLPGYLLENLHLSLFEVALLLLWVLVLYKILRNRELRSLKWLGAISIVYLSVATAQTLDHFATDKIVFHATPKHTTLSFIQGQTAYILADPAFELDKATYDFNLKNYFNALDILTVKSAYLPERAENANLLLRTHKGPVLFDSQTTGGRNKITIIRNKRFPKIASLTTNSKGTYLLSQELGYKTKEKWKSLLEATNQRVLDPSQSGAHEF